MGWFFLALVITDETFSELIRKFDENAIYKMNGCCVSAVIYLEVHCLDYNSEDKISSNCCQPIRDRVNRGMTYDRGLMLWAV